MVAENSSDSELNLQKKFRLQLTQIYSHADICSSPTPRLRSFVWKAASSMLTLQMWSMNSYYKYDY